ncbi:hypothetical protein NIES2100_46720 [Calothrix sp. NIES-2100]|uniref:CIS tube protein n=1 Tax=Calothrix sp. NIES-2100 TaxID=1954172 RepID=UPI000B5E4DD4|nr:hypothetical protein NIES2100_46720 [Calothrix sp. NIES-2100]
MTTTFPGSPLPSKGQIIAIDTLTYVIVSTIAFQYNPESFSRKLQVQAIGGEGGSHSEALRLQGAPVETFQLEIEIDATDQLEKAERTAIDYGIYPQLAALETLIYPKSSQVKTNMDQAKQGIVEIVPYEAPLTLLVWGNKRKLPVRLTDFSINEEAYDVNLNPIRAKMSLGLRVLSYNDLPWDMRSSKLFFNHHKEKEEMAKKANVNNQGGTTAVNIT